MVGIMPKKEVVCTGFAVCAGFPSKIHRETFREYYYNKNRME
jgi:hypothetical protein